MANFFRHIKFMLSAVIAMMLLTACDSLFNVQEGDCSVTYKVQFRYEKNLKWADAFANEVKSVRLFAFNEDGELVWKNSESGPALAANGYAMNLDLAPGKYHLLAWCGLDNDGSRPENFSLPLMEIGEYGIEKLSTKLIADRNEGEATVSDQRLWGLYHGELDVEILPEDEAEPGTYVETMYLTKDTNHIRVILQHLSAEDLDPNDFTFEIGADNGSLDCFNIPIPNDPILYKTWDVKNGEAGVGKEDTRANIVMVKGVIADMHVSRMMASHKKDMMLYIRDKNKQEPIAKIPVIQYALLAKEYYEAEYGHDMDDQEFLDREDEYTLTLFLDQDHKWLSSQIMIHSWVVVPNNVDLY